MSNYFFTDANGQKQGPVNDQHLKELAAQGIIGPNTPMETDTGYQGTAGQIPGLNFNVPPSAPSPFAPPVPQALPTGPTHPLSQTLNTYFMVYWICMAAAIPTCCLSAIAGMIFMYMLLYQLWKLVPPHIAQTSPGKAVGFCFIPFFNFYWIFVAFKGLGEDMNKTLQQRGIHHRVNEGLGLTVCILMLCTLIPYVGLAVAIALHIVLIFFIKSVKDGAIVMLEQGR